MLEFGQVLSTNQIYIVNTKHKQ